MKALQQKSKVALVLLMAVFITACKKEKPGPEQENSSEVPKGTLMLHLHTYIWENEVDAFNIVYTDVDDRKMSLSFAQMYISGIELVKADGSIYPLEGVKILKLFETETYLLAEVPIGNYKSAKFKVGLDAATNSADPSTNTSLLNRPEMWFGTTAQPDGYVFINMQGKIDTTADASGTTAQMQPFNIKIGTGAHYKQVTMPDQPFTITKGNVEYLHMVADYRKLLNGVNLRQPLNVNSVTDNASALAGTIANNIPYIFHYE